MAFFRQLKLLLWKNGLGVFRQPIWSLTLIGWPVIIFIIIAVTRHHFPPVVKQTCYTGVRNLPSAGFFPFLQTLMCNTDSTCSNKSFLTHTSSGQRSSRQARSAFWPQTYGPIPGEPREFFNAVNSENSIRDIEIVKQMLTSILDPTYQGNSNSKPFMSDANATQEPFSEILQSVNMIKRTICTMAQPVINVSSVSPLTEALVIFCKSNDTIFEASLTALNQVLTKLMLTKPDEVLTGAGITMVAFKQLQNQSSLWETLLAIPQLFTNKSLDHSYIETLLTNVQGVLHAMQSEIPEAPSSVYLLQSLLVLPINVNRYVQKWPGKDFSISLGDVVTSHSDSLSQAMKTALQDFKIPLDKALFLLMDRDMLHSYMCSTNTDSMWIAAACVTRAANMFLSHISPDKVAKQILLVWSKNVAHHDLHFVKGMVHSLMGASTPGGQGQTGTTRTHRSVDTLPQNIDQELFLAVGQVAMDIIATVPDMETIVQSILGVSLNSMKIASLTLDKIKEILENVISDATQLQNTYLMLLKNQSEARIWIDHAMDSVMEVMFKILTSTTSITCEEIMGPIGWLLPDNSVKTEVWRSLICQNITALHQNLLMDWLPLIQEGREINSTMMGNATDKVTLPLILSEWQKLSNNTLEFGMVLNRLNTELGAAYWAAWILNSTHDVTEILHQSVFSFMVKSGQYLEKGDQWPAIKNYFHMGYWILKYRPGITTQPPNCSFDNTTLLIECNAELDWSQFVQTAFEALALPSQDVLVNCLKGTVKLLQHVYSGFYKHHAELYLRQEIRGGHALSAYLINLVNNLDGFINTFTQLDDENISNPNVTLPLISNLLQSTGLEVLLPIISADGSLNISSVLDAVIQIGRLNQHICTFNETDTVGPELENLIKQVLSLQGNLTLSLSLSMVRTFFNYTDDFRNADVDHIRDAIQPFINQNATGIVGNILREMEQLKKVMDSPNSDPQNIILLYLHQLQEFLVSAYRLRRIDHILLPSSQLSTAQVTDLHLLVKDLFDLLTPEGLHNLSQAGPDTAQKIVGEKLLAFLPANVQQKATVFAQYFQSLQKGCPNLETDQNCLAEISDFFKILPQILEILLTVEGNITIKISEYNSFGKYDSITTMFFSLLVPQNDSASMRIFERILNFISMVTATPNVTVSHIQNTLRQSNLTLGELQEIASYVGAHNISGLMDNIMEILNAHQCFESSLLTIQCAMQLINGVSEFLAHVPALRNETTILSFIPILINKTVSEVVQTNFTSTANHAVIYVLNSTLAKIKMNLHLIHLNNPEIMEEIRVLESLLQLATNPHSFKANVSGALMKNPFYEEKAYLELVEWYLKKLENITSNSKALLPIRPVFKLVQMQLALQLAQTDFLLFVVNRTEHLCESLQYPIDGEGVSKIGQTTTEILLHLFEFIKDSYPPQNNSVYGTELLFNSSVLYATEQQFKKYIAFVQQLVRYPSVFSSIFQWRNSSLNGSTLDADLQKMLKTVGMLLSKEQLDYLSIVDSVIQYLSKALVAADHLSDIHSGNYSRAILTAVGHILKILTRVQVNDTDSTIPKLERLIKCFLNLQWNFTTSPSQSMEDTFLGYYSSFQPDAVACFNHTFKNLTNQTSVGILQAILRAMKQLKRVLDSPNRDAKMIILAYVHQVQQFLVSAFKLHKFEHLLLLSGQQSTDEVIDLHLFLKDFLTLLTHESLQNFSQAGPYAAQKIVAEKIMDFLAEDVQLNAGSFLQDFQSLQYQITDQNCSDAISEFFKFLDYLSKTLTFEDNATVTIAANISSLSKCEKLTTKFFSLLLSEDSASVVKFKQILTFLDMFMATPNVTVSQVQHALRTSNLTLEDLNHIAGLAGAANIDDLIDNIKKVTHAHQCFASQNTSSVVTAQCLMGLINGLSGFLAHVPAFRNETTILSLIPVLVNQTFSDVMHANFSPNPNQLITHTLNGTLAKVKMTLQLFHLNSSEIMNEIKVLDSLIKLASELNGADGYLKIVVWYLEKLEKITNSSSVSDLLYPFYHLTERYVVFELEWKDFFQFVSNRTQYLLEILQYPVDGTGVSKFGQTTTEILQHLFEFIKGTLEDGTKSVFDEDLLFNKTILHAAEHHFKKYNELLQKWMRKPNITLLLNSVLQWRNSSGNASSAETNLQNMLQLMGTFLSKDQVAYLSIIDNITQSLSKAVMLADQPGGIQSDDFLEAILKAVKNVIQLQTTTEALQRSIQQNILGIVQDSIKLIVQPNISFASSHNISLHILKRLESIIQQTMPKRSADFLMSGIRIATTYFETISLSGGRHKWNVMMLNQLKLVQGFLPSNSTEQLYISLLMNITQCMLESDQENMSLCAGFSSASGENVHPMFTKMVLFLNTLWRLVKHQTVSSVPIPSLEAFADLDSVAEQLLTGQANHTTWNKLEKMLKAVLSLLKGAELWDDVKSVATHFEKVIRPVVNSMQAENVLIPNLHLPVMILMTQLTQSVNTSRFNVSEVSRNVLLAIELTVRAAHQANGTLECSEALKLWEPVREAAGLSHASLDKWCNNSWNPLMESYERTCAAYANMNMTYMDVGSMTVNTTAAMIVSTVRSVYNVNLNCSHVMAELIKDVCSQLSQLAGRPLSPVALLHLHKQLQHMQLQSSLDSIKGLSDELLRVAPFLQGYTQALEKALSHIVHNYHLIHTNSSFKRLFKEAHMIFLTSANISSEYILPMMWGNFSDLSETSVINLMREALALMLRMKLLDKESHAYQVLEQFVEDSDQKLLVQKIGEMCSWWASTQASGLDLLIEALPKMYNILRSFWSVLTQMSVDMPANMELYESVGENIITAVKQMMSTYSSLVTMDHQQQGTRGISKGRRKREAPVQPARAPIDDYIDLFFIDYPTLFRAMSVRPTEEEIMETVHVFLANPDLGIVVKGATKDTPWTSNTSKEMVIDATLEAASFLTLPNVLQMFLSHKHWPPMDLLKNAVDMIPEGFPFSLKLKTIVRALANESQENLILMQHIIQTATELFQNNLTDHFTEKLAELTSQMCAFESSDSIQQLMQALSMNSSQLCQTILPNILILAESLQRNMTELSDAIFQIFIGDPSTYLVQPHWMSIISQSFNFNISSLSMFKINVTSPGVVTVGEMLRNKTTFLLNAQKYVDPSSLNLLLESVLPNKNLDILSWLVKLRHCDSVDTLNMTKTEMDIFRTLCSWTPKQWYIISVLIVRHLNMEKLIYRLVLSEEMQILLRVLIQIAELLTNMMNQLLPAVSQLENYLFSFADLNLMSNSEFNRVARSAKGSMSSKATFLTVSQALCSKGMLAVFGLSKASIASESQPSTAENYQREEMIERFKIPRNATPFCMNIFLDMVNTTEGAIAWAFFKPMLMGQILYTPNTPVTRAIMEKANSTLKEFANLKKYSEDWIESSNYIVKSAEILSSTLPILQKSLGNSLVKNFIEMQLDIDVDSMRETLSKFSNMTVLLEKNKHILKQVTTLSNLMVNISSCIKFDRYQGYDSADQLNDVAQDLVKNRNLFASVIFKLPKDEGTMKQNSTSALPGRVSYTIRMHVENVMPTDRVRDLVFMKDSHISIRKSIRYNRGFIYVQENIERAIIETQTGQNVTELAVQLQPFPYPCHLRDEFLEATSSVFPLVLMLAWILFIADFVKKLVYERELRLHEYMKMMGVNPLSHFFAWFLECATSLVFTIAILTLVLKYGQILAQSDGFLIFLYLCDYGLSILAFSYLVSSFFDKTYIAGLSGSLLYVLCFFPFIVVLGMESSLSFSQKSALSLFSPTCFSYASQYVSRYEAQGQGIQWSNSYTSPIAGDTASFGWLCWLMLIDSILYFIVGAYVRVVFPGAYGIPAPWYFPFKASFWRDICCCIKSSKTGRGLFFTNIMQRNQYSFGNHKEKGQNILPSHASESFSELPVGVSFHGLTKVYGSRVGVQNLNVSFYEGHITSLLGHNAAGKTTTMSLLTGLFAPSAGTIEVYGRDMRTDIDVIRKELGVCMQYDVLFDHMTAKEHLLLYGQIKAPHWSHRELHAEVCKILEETGMYAHRHKRVGTLSGGMRRKLSISIAFIGGSRLVVLDEPTTGVDPCSRRSIWDIVVQHKKNRTIIMSTHHLDEAEVLSDRIAFLERGGLKCCGTPFHLKDMLAQGYNLTLAKKVQALEAEERFDSAELKAFIQAYVPNARLKEVQGSDLVYSLPPFDSSSASSYRSLLTALDANLDALKLGSYGISDTTLEEVFLQLTKGTAESEADGDRLSISETISDSGSIDSFPEDCSGSISSYGDKINLTSSTTVQGMALAWQQVMAILIKRFHHSRRDWKGLLSQVLLPVLFVMFAMGMGSIKSNLQNYPELELSPDLYKVGPSYTFFSSQNPNTQQLVDTMMSSPGIDKACLNNPDNPVYTRSDKWMSTGNSSKDFNVCKCTPEKQICDKDSFHPLHKRIPSSQIVYNLTGINVEKYLVATANDFIRNRYGGFTFGMPLPPDLQMDLKDVPKNRTLSKVWFNPEGHHTMPAYINSFNNFILRSRLPADKDPCKYAISVSSHPYFGQMSNEASVIQGMLQILVAVCILTGYSITTASFAIYEVHEHHSGSKRLQHIAGVSEPLYWAVNFFYDMVIYLVPVALTVGLITAFQLPAFTARQNLAAVALLLVLFGFATFPWMYLLSGVFKDPEMTFISYVCINLFISINTVISISVLYFITQTTPSVKGIFHRLSHAFLIFPQFNFGNGLMELVRRNIDVQILSSYGIDAYKNPFYTDALGWMFISSFLQGLFFFTLRLLLNKWLISRVRHLFQGRRTAPRVDLDDEDEDVVAEYHRVSSGGANSDILQVNQLTKVYHHLNKKIEAVKKISVGVPAGECFGLLGVNGAGKTTTFKILTGDVHPTDGTAQIKDWDGHLVDIMECRDKGINIGYCPQVDALDDLLTGEEHLYFYAHIHGISRRNTHGVVNYLLKKLELNYHRNNVTKGYSCGTRRKLSTAIAMIGHPQILLLDEPSSGMDPRTKRHLWKIISEELKRKCAVILTSHSMEECEALCSRLAIMVKGQFRCLGSLQHIKNRFGSGFTVKMYLARACDTKAITSFMQSHFPSTYLKDQHSTMIEYHVPFAPGGVADIFDRLETNKTALLIKHFSVSQTTLDEVFINFALGKTGMETTPMHSEGEWDRLGFTEEEET